MRLHYVEEVVENVIVEEKILGCYKNCEKCFVGLKDDNYVKNKGICSRCYNESRTENRVV